MAEPSSQILAVRKSLHQSSRPVCLPVLLSSCLFQSLLHFLPGVILIFLCPQFHPSLWLLIMDPACWLSKKDPDFRNQVPEETFPCLLLGAQDQRLGAEQFQLHCGSTGTPSGNCQQMETCIVWACHTS